MSQSAPSIALVVLDTLRKDAFDEHFDWLPGRRFENAWAPSHWTVPVHGSLFTGKYASEIGVHAKSPTFDYPGDSLAEVLSEHGYTTRAFSSNVNIAPPQRFDRGFDEFTGSWRLDGLGGDYFDWGQFARESSRDGLSRYMSAVLACTRSDSRTLGSLKQGVITKLRDLDLNGALVDDGARRARGWLTGIDFDDPEFLFVNLMEAHSPYLPPRGYRTVPRVDVDSIRSYLDAPDVSAEVAQTAYDDSVRYLSDAYREMYGTLDANFDYVITLADHGELLGEHGAWDHLYGLHPELTHVPLVVDGPGFEGVVDATVSLLDVHATILDIAAIDEPSRGRSFCATLDEASWLTEYHGLSEVVRESLTADGYEINSIDTQLRGIVTSEGYGYETPAGFTTEGNDDTADALTTRLAALVDDLETRDVGDESVDEDLLSHLDALGYA